MEEGWASSITDWLHHMREGDPLRGRGIRSMDEWFRSTSFDPDCSNGIDYWKTVKKSIKIFHLHPLLFYSIAPSSQPADFRPGSNTFNGGVESVLALLWKTETREGLAMGGNGKLSSTPCLDSPLVSSLTSGNWLIFFFRVFPHWSINSFWITF